MLQKQTVILGHIISPGYWRTRRWRGWRRCWTWPGWRAPRWLWEWPVPTCRRWLSAPWCHRASSTACSRTPWTKPSPKCVALCAGLPAGWSYPPGDVKEEERWRLKLQQSVKQLAANQWIFQLFFTLKCQIFASSSYLDVRICCCFVAFISSICAVTDS